MTSVESKISYNDERAFSYLVGIGVAHSIAPPMHNYISKSLGFNWQFMAQECPSVEDAISLFRNPTFAGGVVTMPYKTAIMRHLDGLDTHALRIGACNNVYRAANGSLRGTNTDWRGVKGCLLDASSDGQGKPAMIIGAGGASRAALYALLDELECPSVYIVNRDVEEVKVLLEDAKVYGESKKIVHVETIEQAQNLTAPFYIVGTVPDFEPSTPSEICARDIIEHFLSTSKNQGVLLDMCFKPRRTRLLRMGEQYNWQTVEGTGIIGHQIEEQYRLWCGEEVSRNMDKKGAWKVLQEAAESSPAINF